MKDLEWCNENLQRQLSEAHENIMALRRLCGEAAEYFYGADLGAGMEDVTEKMICKLVRGRDGKEIG